VYSSISEACLVLVTLAVSFKRCTKELFVTFFTEKLHTAFHAFHYFEQEAVSGMPLHGVAKSQERTHCSSAAI
jgi:hypothetical protein